ncbi:MAG: porphobilinogen synthase [Bdellovibrionota bacterium]
MDPLINRPRRLRRTPALRRLVRETRLSVDNLVDGIFAVPGKNVRDEIPSMPGVFRYSVDQIGEEAKRIAGLGIPGAIFFGIPEKKDEKGSAADDPHGVVQKAIEAFKKAAPDTLAIADVCLCEYTSHGHCGIVKGQEVLNDPTVERLGEVALSLARAGADVIAPSDMADGRVGHIRQVLDKNGFSHLPILSYAAKYASAFYGPFREAAESTPQFGDRRAYQMDPPNVREAMKEIRLDIEQGADMVMVKPALAYLDVIRAARQEFLEIPLAAYNVSGEYSMVKAAALKGWIDEKRIVEEILTGILRAGADFILTYHAKFAAKEICGK